MSNSITIKGTVHHIGDVETFASGFTKRLLVVDNGEQYDSTVPIEFKKDNGDLLNALILGQTVTVHTNIGGREHNGRYFPSLSGWKIDAEAAPVAAAPDDDELGF
jgi:hypothetical protein